MLDPISDLPLPPSSPTISSVSSSDLDTEVKEESADGCVRRGAFSEEAEEVVADMQGRGFQAASLGEFLEVERRFGDGAFYGAEAAELEGVMGTAHDEQHHEARNGRSLFADGRVLPPVSAAIPPAGDDDDEDEKAPTAGALCRFPVSLTGICSGGVG
ncbi:ABC transporter I family member 17-like [Hibiscus syriacus]|uniref:ABC transporter I family member 17-like n=1 Tax=Hibiscus syriacus TaxID=106335 RepID=A0A6A3B5T6_HIBSY|nr:ABC transporter I family member 17-like [Hibiscus syriacus]